MSRALFLDRDGVINLDHGYVSKPEDFEFVDGIFSLCQRFAEAGFKIVVVTNQSGIARGMYTEEDFLNLSSWMCAEFAKNGIDIAGVFYCPHHPDKGLEQYRQKCDCRKPEPGLFYQAKVQLNIDLESSVMLGDKESDMMASQAAGLSRHILFAYKDNRYLADIDQISDVEIVNSLASIFV